MRGLRFDHQPVERYGVAAPAADAKALVPDATQCQAHLIDFARFKVGKGEVHFAISRTLRRVVAVLGEKFARMLHARQAAMMFEKAALQFMQTKLQLGLDQGPLACGELCVIHGMHARGAAPFSP